MMRIFSLSVIALLGASAWAWGGWFECCNRGIHCVTPPPPDCPDCSDPCCQHSHRCPDWKLVRGQKLIDQLRSADCCCERIKAARKLGCRLHADYCCDPEVLSTLVRALQCDPCWEVRKAAAWSIAHQNARNRLGVLSLYLASRLDPHFLVRDAAGDALSVLIVCRRECYKDLFAAADELVRQLRGKYNPRTGNCTELFEQLGCAAATPEGPAASAATLPPVPAVAVPVSLGGK